MTETIKTILDIEDIRLLNYDPTQLKIIPKETCEKIQAIVFSKEKNTLKIITTNNYPKALEKLLKTLIAKSYKYEIFYTSNEGFEYALNRYTQAQDQETRLFEENRADRQAIWKWAISVIKKIFEKRDTMDPSEFIMQIIRLAFQTGASDLHFQSESKWVEMKLRIDWVLQDVEHFSHAEFTKYLQKLKFISWTKMNVDYMPEDGRFSFTANDKDNIEKNVDARTNFMPGIQNESTVIRFLDSNNPIKTLWELWFSDKNAEIIQKHIRKNSWIIVLSWPTWSWKTTTLYSVLNYLNNWSQKIITLEDPIEYQIEWIQQSQINYSKWYTYEVGLKSILRHDPDIILIWETRSLETAEIWINAALTWHLVFTTLHTSSAIESISRLLNMWVKPYMLSPSVNLIVGQRLVRKVCPYCAANKKANFSEAEEIQESINRINEINPNNNIVFDGNITTSVGCDKCNGTGYIWRIAITEVLEITEEMKWMIGESKSNFWLYGKAREWGFLTMKEDWMIKLLSWQTTLEELRRVL